VAVKGLLRPSRRKVLEVKTIDDEYDEDIYTGRLVLAAGIFLLFFRNFYDFFTPPGCRVQKSTHGLPIPDDRV
jgi:hypothetical protein